MLRARHVSTVAAIALYALSLSPSSSIPLILLVGFTHPYCRTMDEAISQFVSITGASPDKANFYVESAGGDVQEAVSTYFEAEGTQGERGDDHEGEGDGDAKEDVARASGPRTLSGAPAPPLPEGWGAASRSGAGSGTSAQAHSGSGRMASLADYRSEGQRGGGGAGPGSDDDDDDEDDGRDPANFFTGGERSGLSVQNPDHGRRRGGGDAPGVVQDILQRAREAAMKRAEGGLDEDDDDWGEGGPGAGSRKSKKAASSFAGQGRTLADSASANSEQVPSAAAGSAGAGGSSGSSMPGGFQLAGEGARDAEEVDEIVNRRIIFWEDGFSLEDGPLCRYDDPQHAQTLAMIKQGAAPLSFLNVRFGQRVNLTVEQKQEKYKPPPPPPMKAFSGHGNRLGSPAPGIVTGSGSSTPAAAPAASSATSAPPPVAFEVDSSQPTTQLQIRLADGERTVGRFNHTHTVGDVRNYINAAHPGMSSRAYVLQTSFPPKPITNETQSLKDAGLINAVVIQKWT